MNRHKLELNKSEKTNWAIRAAGVGIAAVWLTGCASTGYQRSDAAAVSIQTAAAEVQAEGHALELAVGALKELVNEPAPDLQLQFQHFSGALDRLMASAQRTASSATRMDEKSAAYFQAWEKQLNEMDYEHIRNLSQARKAEVAARYEAVHKRYAETQAVVDPLIGYLQDIRRALSADLTPGGLEAVKSVVTNADQNSGKVQTALAALVGELSASSTKMSSVVLQSAK